MISNSFEAIWFKFQGRVLPSPMSQNLYRCDLFWPLRKRPPFSKRPLEKGSFQCTCACFWELLTKPLIPNKILKSAYTLSLSPQVLPGDRILLVSEIIFMSKFSDLEASIPVACVVPWWVQNTQAVLHSSTAFNWLGRQRALEPGDHVIMTGMGKLL